MDMLDEARSEINRIDREMAKLFFERMKAVEKVSEYKIKHGLPVLDASREVAVLTRNAGFVQDETIRSYYLDFMKSTMKLSRQYQHRLQNGMKIAYCGVEGAFAEIAAKRIFPAGERIGYKDFVSAYKSVEDGLCDAAVLPIENSFAGEVGGVVDLLYNGSLYVNGVYHLKIVQNLLGVKGSTLHTIKTVISHPQALMQCDAYIKKNEFVSIEAENTAAAARYVSEKNDPSVAAIASIDTAQLYSLSVIDHDINQSDMNTTRFAVVSKMKLSDEKNNRSLLMFTVSHEAGSLAKAINVIGKFNFNMTSLKSRPIKTASWQYYFYVELDGNLESTEGQKMIGELRAYCSRVKVLGTFFDKNI